MIWHTIWKVDFLVLGIYPSLLRSIGGGYSIDHIRSAKLSRFVFFSRYTVLDLISTSCTWCFVENPKGVI